MLLHYKIIERNCLDSTELYSHHLLCCEYRNIILSKLTNNTVDSYIYNNPYITLYCYHYKVIKSLLIRDFLSIDMSWYNINHNNKYNIDFLDNINIKKVNEHKFSNNWIFKYPEHTNEYLDFCIHYLKYSKKLDIFEYFNIFDKGEDYARN